MKMLESPSHKSLYSGLVDADRSNRNAMQNNVKMHRLLDFCVFLLLNSLIFCTDFFGLSFLVYCLLYFVRIA